MKCISGNKKLCELDPSLCAPDLDASDEESLLEKRHQSGHHELEKRDKRAVELGVNVLWQMQLYYFVYRLVALNYPGPSELHKNPQAGPSASRNVFV